MRRRLRWLAAALFLFYCSSVLAVGLGELVLNSALNQRFDGEISLTGSDSLERQEIVSKLASQADFDRVGVDRDFQRVDLQFEVRARFDGDYYVHVTSNNPIIEPFLNFIVEVTWPTGRILREYTVLLDPPVFDWGKVEWIEPSRGSGGNSAQIDSSRSGTDASGRGRLALPSVYVNSQGMENRLMPDEYRIGPGDTLWEIAQEVRPDKSMPVPPIMLAIQRENPEAFIRNNINLLKAGYILRIPDLTDLSAEALTEAVAEVKAQNDEYTGRNSDELTQLDARQSARIDDGAFTEAQAADGELRLIASSGQSGRRSGTHDATSDRLENALPAVSEELDLSRRANTELSVRIDDLANQVDTLNDIVSLKDDQLAALQAELQRVRTGETPSALPAVSSSSAQPQKTISFLNSPVILAGLAVAVIAAVVSAMMLVRRRRESIDLDDVYQAASPNKEIEESGLAEIYSEGAEAEESKDATQQSCDVIDEADTYIAHGRFAKAISSLQKGLEIQSDRADLQLKLLEVYVRTEDANAFDLQLERLKTLGDIEASDQAIELQKQITGRVETSSELIDRTIENGEVVMEVADKDDDLSFGLDELGVREDMVRDLEPEDLNFENPMERDVTDLAIDLGSAIEEADAELGEELDLEDELYLDLEDLDIGEDEEVSELNPAGGDEVELDMDDDLDDLSLVQDAGSKLGLARAYIEMGDKDGAREVLHEVINEGADAESAEANEMLDKLD